jgi:hypothetical protein
MARAAVRIRKESMSRPLIVGAIVIVALYAMQVLLSNRAGSSDEVKAIIATMRPAAWSFIALEYCYGILNRTYVVFVTENVICGARVRGTLPAPLEVTKRWRDPLFYPRPALIARYADIDLESERFTAVSKANFHLRRDQIDDVEFTNEPKWGMGKVPYSGRLVIFLKDGTKKELILLGTQDGPFLRKRLKANGFGRTPRSVGTAIDGAS